MAVPDEPEPPQKQCAIPNSKEQIMACTAIRFPEVDPALRRARLELPTEIVDAVLDTDTFNEVDDQFALTYALLAKETLRLRAVTAAPFLNSRSTSPADGMEKSFEEIGRILALLNHPAEGFAFRGSAGYLPDRNTPVDSEAARRIVELAHEQRRRGKALYVFAIATITNVASALLLDPEIVRDVVVIWLGGHDRNHPDNREFNLYQDVPAAQVIFDSGVPFFQVPCCTVAELLATTPAELRELCTGTGAIGEFLLNRTLDYIGDAFAASKVIWDISVIGWLRCRDGYRSEVLPAPRLDDSGRYLDAPAGRHEMRIAAHIRRDQVFADLSTLLRRNAAQN